MLVLTRHRESGIHIGSDITVRVLSINRSTVKLGIEAPQSVRVVRDELAPIFEQPHPSEPLAIATGMKIVLVVEDDPGHAKLIRKALCQAQGTMVTVADSGGNALDALGARATNPEHIVKPDLILLDLGLPDGSGLEVLRLIRSVPELRTSPVVVLSCSDDEKIMQQCLEAGANAFVVKSANYDDFQALVRRIGQFWAGDCFASRHSTAPSQDNDSLPTVSTVSTDADVAHDIAGIQGKKILLVEDDRGHVTLIKRALQRAHIDCSVDIAGDGVEAIDYLFGIDEHTKRQRNVMPDMILLDLNMPKMNGRQVLKVLRKTSRKERINLPPIVVMTSSDEEADINDSYKLGAQSFIRKPADHGRFMAAVQQTSQYWLGLNKSASCEVSEATPVRVPR